MSNSKKWLVVLLSVLITVLCGVALAACNTNSNWRKPKDGITDDGSRDPNNPDGSALFYSPAGTDTNQYIDDENAYILKTVSKGGIPLNDVKITVSENGIVKQEARSVNGEIKLPLPAGDYQISYDELPAGYFADEETVTALTKDTREVIATFNSAVIDSTVPASHTYRAGEVMYNFSFTDADGYTVELKELLQTYKFVLLNMFYNSCGPCRAEFPAMQQTYEQFSDRAYIVSINDHDGPNDVRAYKQAGYVEQTPGGEIQHPYTFFMARDSRGLTARFGTGAYPTNVFIDRYGVIAYIETGTITDSASWLQLFSRFCSDDYTQNQDLIGGSSGSGGSGTTDPALPPEDMHMPSNQQLSDAVIDASMRQGGANEYPDLPLRFYGPDPDDPEQERDAKYSWPFRVGYEADGSSYITPGNVGTDNTFSILYTDVTLQPNDVLSLEIKLNIETSGDRLYLIMNNTLDYDFVYNGGTDGKWQEVVLYTATRTTAINLNIMFVKDLLGEADGEFVGIRNLKVSPIDTDTNVPLDIRTEMATPAAGQKLEECSSMEYAEYYLNATDGYYHVKTSSEPTVNDPIVYFDVLNETTWSIRHLNGYTPVDDKGKGFTKSVYNLSIWLFNDNEAGDGRYVFSFDPKSTIIDAYYIQSYTTQQYLTPVTKDIHDALQGFTKRVSEDDVIGKHYKNGFDEEHDWLELCVYYKTMGGNHAEEGHLCLSTNSPTPGLSVSFAIPVESSTNAHIDVNSPESTSRNRAGGLFYKFTAPTAGVYDFTSSNQSPSTGVPKIYIWGNAGDAYTSNPPIAEVEGFSHVVTYLSEGQNIWLQLTQVINSEDDPRITYEVSVTRTKDEDWVLTVTNQDNVWTYDEETGILYFPTIEMTAASDGVWYHYVGGEQCSPIYINFTRANQYSTNRTLEAIINEGHFGDFGTDALMRSFLAQSKEGKQPTDEDYGLLEATNELVQALAQYTQSRDPQDTLASGAWKEFALYYRYYGPTVWKELPEGWPNN